MWTYNSLCHTGVKGMRWGHHKTTKTKVSNIDKWGSDASHNILYITGYSGSGKSTIAKNLKDKNTNVIHLDAYFENMSQKDKNNMQDKDFNNFIKNNMADYGRVATDKNRHTKDHWDIVDKFMLKTQEFAATQYPNKKVIIEGVQLADGTTYPNKSFFKDKPIIVAQTNPIKSYVRSAKRDNKNIFNTDLQSAKEYIQWYSSMNDSLLKLEKDAAITKGKKFVLDHLY